MHRPNNTMTLDLKWLCMSTQIVKISPRLNTKILSRRNLQISIQFFQVCLCLQPTGTIASHGLHIQQCRKLKLPTEYVWMLTTTTGLHHGSTTDQVCLPVPECQCGLQKQTVV